LVLVPRVSLGQPQRDANEVLLDPVGTWSCVLYGNPSLGDERVLLSFGPDQSARIARQSRAGAPAWTSLSRWQVEGGLFSFADGRSGRQFSADLDRQTLGGEWRTLNLLGGWWCSAADAAAGPSLDILSDPSDTAAARTARLIPEVMATPSFPIRAIRAAKEGRVVLCFVVHPSGEVYDPEFVELSDEIFRAPSLDALMRSRYKAWDSRTAGGPRPACRSFIYRLDYVF
jgi:hypothetical protein